MENKISDDLSSDRNEARSLEGEGKNLVGEGGPLPSRFSSAEELWWEEKGEGEGLMKTERCFAEA